jgi:L-ascorbate metabolism protein UlaG (beta-lactamase superfamily)
MRHNLVTLIEQEMKVAFAGHSTILIELDGARVLTDPLFRSALLHLQRQAPLVDLDRFGKPDVLLISHSHLDHLDKRSLKLVDKNVQAIVPSDCEKLIRAQGFTDVTGVRAGDQLMAAGLSVTAVHADHGGKRMPWNQPAETIGFIVEGSQSVYYAGDTDLFDEMAELHPALDVALLPVWGWGPKLGVGHLDPDRAAEAAALIAPRIAVPVHWGGYLPAGMAKRRPDLLIDPPRRFKRVLEAAELPGIRVELIEPGEEISVSPEAAST